MKSIAVTIYIFLLLNVFLNFPCDAIQLGKERGRERGMERGSRFRTRSLKQSKASNGKDAKKSPTGASLVGDGPQLQGTQQYSLSKGSCKETKGGNRSKGKAGAKGVDSSCSPTASPSPSESPSKDPSATPSTIPSSSPSFSPSASPSASPSEVPSAAPSRNPSSSPSLTPSEIPSMGPSNTPSVTPSTEPSSFPSYSPSVNPSTSPSNYPSTAPSLTPSSLPSFTPSLTPSRSPSDDPTIQPSTEPSNNPTISAVPSQSIHPTITVYETISAGSQLESTCISPEPSDVDGGNFNENQLLVFEYLLFIPVTVLENDDKDVIVATMEKRIHEGLVQNFLTCNPVQGEKLFYVWSISSNPPDFISSDPCNSKLVAETNPTPPDGSKCIVVQAELNMRVYFPPNRRHRHLSSGITRILQPPSTTSADHQVMAASGGYLVTAMSQGTFNDSKSILQTHFLAFITEEGGHATIDRGQLNVAGANGQWMTQHEESRVVGGAITMAAAAVCFLVVAALALRRRKLRSDAFLRHIDDLSTFSDFEKDAFGRGTEIISDLDNNSLGWFGEDFHDGMCLRERDNRYGSNSAVSLDRQHDVHKCTSAFCVICLKQQSPTFIASNSMNIPDILEDLRGGSSIVEDSRSYTSPNTVDL